MHRKCLDFSRISLRKGDRNTEGHLFSIGAQIVDLAARQLNLIYPFYLKRFDLAARMLGPSRAHVGPVA